MALVRRFTPQLVGGGRDRSPRARAPGRRSALATLRTAGSRAMVVRGDIGVDPASRRLEAPPPPEARRAGVLLPVHARRCRVHPLLAAIAAPPGLTASQPDLD